MSPDRTDQTAPLTAVVEDDAYALACKLHDEAIVYDSAAPLFPVVYPRGADEYRAGGVTAIASTAYDPNAMSPGPEGGLHGLKHNRALIAQRPDELLLVESVDDLHRAREDGRLGVVFHWQNCTYFGDDEGLVEPFHALGLRIAQLTYNVRNLVGDGCTEPADAGLSRFGTRLVKALNHAGIVVDGSHTGERTTLEAMEVSEAPFVFTHSGCRAVHDHVRNLTDTQVRECAATGGVIGVLGLPYFIGPPEDPTIEQIVRHAAYISELVGVDHVGLGMDYWHGVTPYMSEEEQLRLRERENHTWRPGDIPNGAWSYAPGIQTPAGMRNLTAAFLRHGFTYDETVKIVGDNFLRVFAEVWTA